MTLAVSRDGVSLGIGPFGNFEMASVATLSVYDDGQRIGTIYLACAPEENQETLSRNFTSLLKSIIRRRGSKLSRIVYVSDAGKIETAYWKKMCSAICMWTVDESKSPALSTTTTPACD